MSLQLTDFETFMARAAERGDLCDFTQAEFRNVNRIEISAEAIRALMLGLAVRYAGETEDRIVRISGPGVRLKKPAAEIEIKVLQATITGRLDLEHARLADGASLPPLSLLACAFDQPILLSHAHIRGLSLAGSQFSYLCASQACIEGSVDLSGVRGMATGGAQDTPQCWVDFEGARIGGTFSAPGAQLAAPARRSDLELAVEPKRNALNLAHAHVDSVILNHGFSAVGGLSLALAQIDGSVRLNGSRLTAREGQAIYAPNVEVRGNIYLRPGRNAAGESVPFHVEGGVNIYYGKIGGRVEIEGGAIDGTLSLQGAEIKGHVALSTVESGTPGNRRVLPLKISGDANLSGLQLNGAFRLAGVEITGTLDLSNARLNSNLDIVAFHGAAAEPPADTIIARVEALTLSSAQVGGDLDIQGLSIAADLHVQTLTVQGIADLQVSDGFRNGRRHSYRLTVGGDVWLAGARFGSFFTIAGADITGELHAPNSTAGADFSLTAQTGFIDGEETTFRFEAKMVGISGTTVGNNLDLTGSRISEDFSARNVSVGGDVYVCATYTEDRKALVRFTARHMTFSSARIEGSVVAGGAELTGELRADNAEVGGDFNANAFGSATVHCPFEATKVSLWGAKISRDLVFSGARIGSDISASGLSVGGDIYICTTSLGGAWVPFHAASLDFWGVQTGGDILARGAQFSESLSIINSAIGGDVVLRKDTRPEGKKLSFTAKALKLMGTSIGADLAMQGSRVNRANLNNTQIAGNFDGGGFLTWLTWGRRQEYWSAVTFSLCIAASVCLIGWVGVRAAHHQLRPQLYAAAPFLPAESVMVLDTGSVQTRDQVSDDGKKYLHAANEKPCGDQIDPLIYAVDMFIPLLDLRQESRCAITAVKAAAPWRIAALIYSLIGWALTSWTLFHLGQIATSGTDAGRRR